METKIKTPGLPVVTAKSLLPLNTIPVGLPTVAGGVGGIVTLNNCFAPEPSYSVETPVALSETHQGVPVPLAIPHGFFRSGSRGFVPSACVAETRIVC